MKAAIKDMAIHITAETIEEAYAMLYMQGQNDEGLMFVTDWSIIDALDSGTWKTIPPETFG